MLNKKGASFTTILSVIGAILIAIGFAWLIAQNWSYIPGFFKFTILFGFTAAAYTAGVILREKKYFRVAKSLFVLGALLFTLSIFLTAQIFNLPPSMQGTAWLILISLIGVTFSAYLFDSYATLIISLVEFMYWVSFQFIALNDKFYSFSVIYYIFLSLICGVFFYSIYLWHRAFKHKFARLFQWWTVFYFLWMVYLLSFQSFIPILWAGENNSIGSSLLFLSVFAVITFIILISGVYISVNSKSVSGKEVMVFFAIIFILIVMIGITKIPASSIGSCVARHCGDYRDQNSCNAAPKSLSCAWSNNYCTQANYQNNNYQKCMEFTNNKNACLSNEECKWQAGSYSYFNIGKNVPAMLWAVWIVINIFFILFILSIIAYGSVERFPAIINIGIIFFVLDIITRYIGFIMNLWGYTSLALLFITGGGLLIFGGIMIEKWRRKLISDARTVSSPLTPRFQARIKPK